MKYTLPLLALLALAGYALYRYRRHMREAWEACGEDVYDGEYPHHDFWIANSDYSNPERVRVTPVGPSTRGPYTGEWYYTQNATGNTGLEVKTIEPRYYGGEDE